MPKWRGANEEAGWELVEGVLDVARLGDGRVDVEAMLMGGWMDGGMALQRCGCVVEAEEWGGSCGGVAALRVVEKVRCVLDGAGAGWMEWVGMGWDG
jgi:hypothetical protein